ncbi:hypothetical protein PHYBOEH_011365 [Phytophthora boehmeriae]|uniref:Carbohydrate kinase FGGY N-terminal domain-containing protein n=1 Tax=Phytophthora boehmeriae TaxID=109152 RepID=A0A8T1WYE6_9STRA|nr:hypothetical protein PHYBOEH_011365 [Phytophthora boehmeriae]
MKLVLPLLASASVALAFAYRSRQLRLQQQEFMRGAASPEQYRDLPVCIVVDVGSSSVRASCWALAADAHWVLIEGSLQQQHQDSIDVNGEADAVQIAATVEKVMDGALYFLRVAGLTNKLVGVGFSTFAMNVLGVDTQGNAITPVYTYAGRRQATAEWARTLQERLSALGELDETHNRTGVQQDVVWIVLPHST